MPTILQLISSSGFYGADNVLIELSKQLSRTEYSPIVGVFNNLYNPHLEIAEVAEANGLPVQFFPCRGKLDPRTIVLLRRFQREQKIRLIHAHGYKTNFYVLASMAGRRVPCMTTCHNWLGDDSKMRFYAWLDKALLKRFDRVVAVSDPVLHEVRRHGIRANKAVKVLNGIDVKKYSKNPGDGDLKRELGIPANALVIGTVGRLAEEKGQALILGAAAGIIGRYPDVAFLFVGDGPLRATLESRAGEVSGQLKTANIGGGPYFFFPGVRSDMPQLYGIMDFFVLPSLNEGLPMVLLEAMAAGKPILASKVGAIPKVLDNGRCGMLIPPGDQKQLEEALLWLLGDTKQARRLGESARARVVKEFSSKSMADKYIGIYDQLLGVAA